MAGESMLVIKFFPIGSCSTCFAKRKEYYAGWLKKMLGEKVKMIGIELYDDWEVLYARKFVEWLAVELVWLGRSDIEIVLWDSKNKQERIVL